MKWKQDLNRWPPSHQVYTQLNSHAYCLPLLNVPSSSILDRLNFLEGFFALEFIANCTAHFALEHLAHLNVFLTGNNILPTRINKCATGDTGRPASWHQCSCLSSHLLLGAGLTHLLTVSHKHNLPFPFLISIWTINHSCFTVLEFGSTFPFNSFHLYDVLYNGYHSTLMRLPATSKDAWPSDVAPFHPW